MGKKLTEEIANRIKTGLENKVPMRKLAVEVGVSAPTIYTYAKKFGIRYREPRVAEVVGAR